MLKRPYFYGLQPRWFGPDRLFKVFTLSASICAARVAGQFWDDRSARLILLGEQDRTSIEAQLSASLGEWRRQTDDTCLTEPKHAPATVDSGKSDS
jgi:hypothetical protein